MQTIRTPQGVLWYDVYKKKSKKSMVFLFTSENQIEIEILKRSS